jgi:hypothetical protein
MATSTDTDGHAFSRPNKDYNLCQLRNPIFLKVKQNMAHYLQVATKTKLYSLFFKKKKKKKKELF